jgi:hypothetical protein
MSAPRFVSTPVDPRRLSTLDHQRARQTYGERRRIYGAIEPMPRDCAPASWGQIGRAAAIAVAIVAALWIVVPGAAWLTVEIGRRL